MSMAMAMAAWAKRQLLSHSFRGEGVPMMQAARCPVNPRNVGRTYCQRELIILMEIAAVVFRRHVSTLLLPSGRAGSVLNFILLSAGRRDCTEKTNVAARNSISLASRSRRHTG